MDKATALHTAARRFCQTEFSRWSERNTALVRSGQEQIPKAGEIGWDYSDAAYEIFPRYRLAQAILDEVEKIVPGSVGSLNRLREHLLQTADRAQTQLVTELHNPRAIASIVAEAGDYRAHIGALTTLELDRVEPLPYRRVLVPEEGNIMWERLANRWGVGGECWFPLKAGEPPPNVIAFHEELFSLRGGTKMLREVLATHGMERVFQLYGWRPPDCDYEIELSIFEPARFNGSEQYFTSEEVDWLVYASHESSITVAGDWLAGRFRESWTDWNERTYQGPFSTPNLRGTWQPK